MKLPIKTKYDLKYASLFESGPIVDLPSFVIDATNETFLVKSCGIKYLLNIYVHRYGKYDETTRTHEKTCGLYLVNHARHHMKQLETEIKEYIKAINTPRAKEASKRLRAENLANLKEVAKEEGITLAEARCIRAEAKNKIKEKESNLKQSKDISQKVKALETLSPKVKELQDKLDKKLTALMEPSTKLHQEWRRLVWHITNLDSALSTYIKEPNE